MIETYQCQSCKRTATIQDDNTVPMCCGKKMHKIPQDICLQPAHPEHARPMEDDDACDDFRAGQ